MANKVFKNAVLHWKDPNPPVIGAGVSRPKEGQQTRDYTLMVWFAGTKPMRVVLPAPSGREARKYASNRWPSATKIDLIK